MAQSLAAILQPWAPREVLRGKPCLTTTNAAAAERVTHVWAYSTT